MDSPSITRRHRPFLAPVWLTLIAMLALIGAAIAAYCSAATTTVIVVRHAEKQLGTIDDPPLAPEGELRAQRLARMFSDGAVLGRVGAIYVTDTRRSQMTAAPLAQRLGIAPTVVATADSEQFARLVIEQHRGGTVLIVGHSNTVPDLVRILSKHAAKPTIGEGDYSGVYIVSRPTFGPASVLQLAY